jgi:hypothetical protein
MAAVVMKPTKETTKRNIGSLLCARSLNTGYPEPDPTAVKRLTPSAAFFYVMLADTLAELQAMLPPGLARSPRQPVDPPDVVEIWFAE